MSALLNRRATRSTALVCAASLLAVVLALSVASAAPTDQPMALGPNLIRNGSFFVGDHFPDGWHWQTEGGARAAVTLSDSTMHWGHRSMRLRNGVPPTLDAYGSLATEIRGVRPGANYVLRLWAKGEDVGEAWFGGGPNWAVRESFPMGSYDWQMLELRLSAPDDAGATFDLRINVDGPTGSLWIADVSFQELRPASAGGETNDHPGTTYYPPNVVVPPAPPAYYYPPSYYYPRSYWYGPSFSVVVPFGGHRWGYAHRRWS